MRTAGIYWQAVFAAGGSNPVRHFWNQTAGLPAGLERASEPGKALPEIDFAAESAPWILAVYGLAAARPQAVGQPGAALPRVTANQPAFAGQPASAGQPGVVFQPDDWLAAGGGKEAGLWALLFRAVFFKLAGFVIGWAFLNPKLASMAAVARLTCSGGRCSARVLFERIAIGFMRKYQF